LLAGTGTQQHPADRARSGKRVQAWLLNLSFYPLMALWTVVGILASPFCLVLWKLTTRWDLGRIMRHLISLHGYGLIVIVSPFVRFKARGFAEIKRPCILVVNHLSFFDSYFMAALPFHDLIFAVGAWPFKMYWYTAFMRLAQYLDVEKGDWGHVVRTSTRSFEKKGGVLFFPEGHRSRTGKLQPFFSGAFRLSKETGVPIVPLCITGTDTMLPPGHCMLHPARVRLQVLESVDPAAFPGPLGHLAMRRAVRERMAQGLKELQDATW
jgi:1-acyl-sn-glycerol-3-phosphate acyltransferase